MRTIRTPIEKKYKGIAVGWAIVTIMVLVGIMALMLEGGRIYYTSHHLQNTADAAALAGSRYVAVYTDPNYNNTPATNAREVALYYAQQNHVLGDRQIELNLNESNDPAGEIVIGKYISQNAVDDDPTTFAFTPTLDTPNAMKVLDNMGNNSANAPLPMILGKIFGGQPKHLSRYAIAKIDNPYGAGLLALRECCNVPGLVFGGSGSEVDLTIYNGGALYVNSCLSGSGNKGAIDQTGNSDPDINVEFVYAVGDLDSKMDLPPTADVQTGVDPEPDPYELVPDAVYDTDIVAEPNISTSGVYSPGYYPGGMQVQGEAVIELLPGDYYLDSIGENASMHVNGGTITGENVTLHILGESKNGVDIQGNANIGISAPNSGDYAGIAIFQKRYLPYDCALSLDNPESEISGTGVIHIAGAVYMPHNQLSLGGTGDIYLERAIADRFYIYGNGKKEVNYKGNPEIAEKSYLVE